MTKILWKGSASMGILTTLLMTGAGVYRALYDNKGDSNTERRVLIIGILRRFDSCAPVPFGLVKYEKAKVKIQFGRET